MRNLMKKIGANMGVASALVRSLQLKSSRNLERIGR